MVEPREGRPPLLTLAQCVAGVAGWLVPASLRADWEREWRAELWHLYRGEEKGGHHSARKRADLLLRSAGSVSDALQLRLGDRQAWAESVSPVSTRWGVRTPAVTVGLLFLSVGIAADATAVVKDLPLTAEQRRIP
jgi:hypothetical protein